MDNPEVKKASATKDSASTAMPCHWCTCGPDDFTVCGDCFYLRTPELTRHLLRKAERRIQEGRISEGKRLLNSFSLKRGGSFFLRLAGGNPGMFAGTEMLHMMFVKGLFDNHLLNFVERYIIKNDPEANITFVAINSAARKVPRYPHEKVMKFGIY